MTISNKKALAQAAASPEAGTALGELVARGEAALKGRNGAIDAPRRAVFLRELMRTPIVGVAARRAGLTARRVMAERERSEIFRVAWDEAVRGSVDSVEQILVEKAHTGELKAIEMVLKAHRPDKYRDRHEVAVVSDSVIEVNLVAVDKSLQTKE